MSPYEIHICENKKSGDHPDKSERVAVHQVLLSPKEDCICVRVVTNKQHETHESSLLTPSKRLELQKRSMGRIEKGTQMDAMILAHCVTSSMVDSAEESDRAAKTAGARAVRRQHTTRQ